MNKALFIIGFLAIVFAGAFIISNFDDIQSAHACPNKSSGTATSNVNPIISSNMNIPLSQSQISPSQQT